MTPSHRVPTILVCLVLLFLVPARSPAADPEFAVKFAALAQIGRAHV